MNGKSRAKGRRGEQYITRRLGGKRAGIAGVQTSIDVVTDFGQYQVKNYALGSAPILECLNKMQIEKPEGNHFVICKPKRGQWLVVQTLEQFQELHGEGEKETK